MEDMWDKKRELKGRYDSTADSYDNRYRAIQERKFLSIKEDLEGSNLVLDVGCGTGLLLNKISGFGKTVIGIDFSSKMLRKAKNRSCPNRLLLADADYLPFKDESFEAVVSLTLLQNMPDPAKTVREMARVTKVDGKVIVTVLEKKHSINELGEWMSSANLKLLRAERISDSEDILCVSRCEE